MFHASHFPGFITLIILVKVVYELRILLRNLSLHWCLKVHNFLWRVTFPPLGGPVVASASLRPNGRRQLGISLKRLFEEAETDLSRPNAWGMVMIMMMMMTEKFEVLEELLRITQKSSRTAWPVRWRHQRSFETSSTTRSTTRRHIFYLYEASDYEIVLILEIGVSLFQSHIHIRVENSERDIMGESVKNAF